LQRTAVFDVGVAFTHSGISPPPIPEPVTSALMLVGRVAFGAAARRRTRR